MTLLVAAAAVAAFVQFGSLAMAALVTAVGIGIGAVEGNLLTPWLMSRAGADAEPVRGVTETMNRAGPEAAPKAH